MEKLSFKGKFHKPFFDFWLSLTKSGNQSFALRQLPLMSKSEFKTQGFVLDKDVEKNIKEMAGSNEQISMVIIMGFLSFVLSKYSDEQQVIIKTPLYKNDNEQDVYANDVSIFIDVDQAKTISEFLNYLQNRIKNSYKYQNFPKELLVQNGDEEMVASNVLICFETINEMVSDRSEFDLILVIRNTPDKIILDVTYNQYAFQQFFIENLVRHFNNALGYLKALKTRLKDILLLSSEEVEMSLRNASGPEIRLDHQDTLVSLFERQVSSNPYKTALDFYDVNFTYGELNHQADKLAHYLLKEYKIKPDQIVGILLDKNQDIIISILAILKAGAAFLPIDPDVPQTRKHYMLEDCSINLVITDSFHLYNLPNYTKNLFVVDLQQEDLSFEIHKIGPKVKSQDLAYVIYTSGSTGLPKGVMVEHASIVNTCLDQIGQFKLDSTDYGLQFATLSFDASIYEIFNTLLAGATLVMIKDREIKDPNRFITHIHNKKVTMVTLPPVYLNKLPLERLSLLKTIVTAGEAANVKDALFCSQHSNYYNAYGPTECAVCVSVHKLNSMVEAIQNIPIGTPLSNLYVLILDEHGHLVPKGVTGELYVGGIGLARGYVNNPEYNAAKFVSNPYNPKDRIYRTGDLGKWLESGEIEYIGRVDLQVKVRGFRIELGEIESCMRKHSLVADCVAVVKEFKKEKAIVAYWKCNKSKSTTEADFNTFLQHILPKYMIPGHYVELEAFPLTINGKIDRNKLKENYHITNNKASVKPKTQMEIQLANIWEEVLGIENIGVKDNFFDLGGNSINAIKVIGSINEQILDKSAQISDLFTYNNIEQLAKILDDRCNKQIASDEDELNKYSKVDF